MRVGRVEAEPYTPVAGIPAGTALGPLAYAAAVDSVFALPFHRDTYTQLFADDTILMRALNGPEDEASLRADLQLLADHLLSKGLHLNAAKSKVLVVELGKPNPIQPPLLINGEPVEEVSKIRYLGCILDKRMTFGPNWDGVCSSAKSAMGAMRRLVEGDVKIMRHLYQERIRSILLFHLYSHPPALERSWERLEALVSYSASAISNQWWRRGTRTKKVKEAFVRSVGLETGPEMAALAAVQIFYSARVGGRRIGEWMEDAPQPERRTRASQAWTPLNILPPKTRVVAFDLLLPIRGAYLWNAIANEILKALGQDLTPETEPTETGAGQDRRKWPKFSKAIRKSVSKSLPSLPIKVKRSFHL